MGVWHFGTGMGTTIQREQGICFESQFDGLRKTAKLLAERARSQAR